MSEQITSPWISMWTKPRATIRSIVEKNARFRFLILSFFYGLPVVLQAAQNASLSLSLPFTAIVLYALFLATFIGMTLLSIYSLLLTWTSRWLGGEASFLQVRCAVSWSNLPSIAAVCLWMGLAFYFKESVFNEQFANLPFSHLEGITVMLVFLSQFILTVWTWFLMVVSLSEVEGFSIGRSIISNILAYIGGMILLVLFVRGLYLILNY